MSQIILRQDLGILVTLEEGGIVKKIVSGLNVSGLRKVKPKEIIDREIRALQLLEDVPGIQRFVKRESDNVLYTIYIPGNSLLKSPKHSLNHQYFNELRSITEQCENKGVYRLGQNRRDFIVSSKVEPGIIDFGNILFEDDSITRIPGIISLAKLYSNLRIRSLRKRYTSRNGFKLFRPSL